MFVMESPTLGISGPSPEALSPYACPYPIPVPPLIHLLIGGNPLRMASKLFCLVITGLKVWGIRWCLLNQGAPWRHCQHAQEHASVAQWRHGVSRPGKRDGHPIRRFPVSYTRGSGNITKQSQTSSTLHQEC
jgi:hypothetical protein